MADPWKDMEDAEPACYVVHHAWLQSLFRRGFTYNDYKTWPDNVNAEIIDGVVYLMASPSERHAFIQGEIFGQLRESLRGKPCTPYTAKFGVRLEYDETGLDKTTVGPDVFVVCDPAKVLNLSTCQGTPDFIVEIVSKNETRKDLDVKRRKYEQAGVREYWVVERKHLHVFVLENGKYAETVLELAVDLKQPVRSLDGCVVDFGPIVERYRGSDIY